MEFIIEAQRKLINELLEKLLVKEALVKLN